MSGFGIGILRSILGRHCWPKLVNLLHVQIIFDPLLFNETIFSHRMHFLDWQYWPSFGQCRNRRCWCYCDQLSVSKAYMVLVWGGCDPPWHGCNSLRWYFENEAGYVFMRRFWIARTSEIVVHLSADLLDVSCAGPFIFCWNRRFQKWWTLRFWDVWESYGGICFCKIDAEHILEFHISRWMK